MKYTIRLCFYLCILIMHSCANIGTLGGGKEDTEAPKLINTNITGTNFTSRKITLDFNEYVITSNPEKNILIQPSHTTLKYTIQGKRITILLDSSLHDNTTYTLIINKGIVDNNANNYFNYSKTFSTGNTIDSGRIQITLKSIDLYKNLKIALSTKNGTDSFKEFKTDYILDVTSDKIEFNGLGKINYNLWLFTDNNSDLKPDLYQPVNFIANVETDSSYVLEPFPWNEPFRIKSGKTDKLILKLNYTRSIDYIDRVKQAAGISNEDILYLNEDSAMLFLDSTKQLTFKTDTVPLIDYKNEIKKRLQNSINIIKLKNEYQVTFIRPSFYMSDKSADKKEIIKQKKTDSICLYRDQNTSNLPDTFRINKSPIIDYKLLSFLKLEINNKNNKNNNTYDVLIIKDNKIHKTFKNINSVEAYIEPGIYKVVVYENSLTKIFNPFLMAPYPDKLYEKDIILKANWEEVLDINIR